jgi:hypothetical protein
VIRWRLVAAACPVVARVACIAPSADDESRAADRRSQESARPPDPNAGQVVEAGPVRGDDDPASCERGGGDDEVVGATWSAGFAYGYEQLGVRSSDVDVVADDGQCLDDVVEERLSRLSALARGDVDADAELGDRDGSNGGLVVVGDEFVEVQR